MNRQIVVVILAACLTVTGFVLFQNRSKISNPVIVLSNNMKQESVSTSNTENKVNSNKPTYKIIPGVPPGPFPIKGPYNNNDLKALAEKVAIKTVASKKKAVIICVLDTAYVEMFYTFVESAQRAGLRNVIAVTLTKEASDQLNTNGYPNYYANNKNGVSKSESAFRSEGFNKKASWKFIVSLRLLELGYSVLALDLDNFFLRDPFKHFGCMNCDFEIQIDRPDYQWGDICVGIIYYRPTANTKEFLKQHTATMASNPKQWDQPLFSKMAKEWKAKLKVNYLPFSTFPSGLLFNEHENVLDHYLPEDNCIVIYHNNWVIGIQPKEYRAKELGMWLSDTNQYYTSSTRKYLTYSNPVVSYKGQEMKVLERAYKIAESLNRTLILPSFHNGAGKLGTLEYLGGGGFISKHKWNFREHSFLKHSKVPETVKNSISKTIFVDTGDSNVILESTNDAHIKKLNSKVVPVNELIALNKEFSDVSILKFHSLYFDVDFTKK